MRKKAIVAGAVLIAVVLCITIFFGAARPSPVPITVRHIQSVRSGDGVEMTFGITNHTTSSYRVSPVSVEVRNGLVWKECFAFNSHLGPFLSPHRSETFALSMSDLPTGSPLRFRLRAQKILTSLNGFIRRLKLNLRFGHPHVSLNPFDKTITVFGNDTQIVSDEFVEPEPNPVVKGASDK